MNANRFFQSVAPTATAATADAVVGEVNLGAVEQAAAEVQMLDYEIQQLENVAQQIDNLHDVAEGSLEDGGLTAQAYTVVQSQAASIMAFAGHNPVTVNQQSFEGGIADRQTGTNVTMMALKETAKNIWAAIIKAIKEAIEKVKTWFAKMTNSVPSMIKAFEEVKDKAGKKTGGFKDDVKDIKLSASNVAAVGEGKTPKIDRNDIPKLLTKLDTASADIRKAAKGLNNICSKASDLLGTAGADNVKDIKDTVTSATVVVGAIASLGTDVKLGKPTDAQIKDLSIGEDSAIRELGVGNQAIVLNLSATDYNRLPKEFPLKENGKEIEGKDEAKAFVKAILTTSNMQLSIRNKFSKVEDADELEIKPFGSGEIVTMCDDAISILTGFKTYKEDQVKIDKTRDEGVKKAEQFSAKAGKLKGPDADPSLVALTTDSAKAATNAFRGAGSLVPSYVGLLLRVSNVVLSVTKDSLSAHK